MTLTFSPLVNLSPPRKHVIPFPSELFCTRGLGVAVVRAIVYPMFSVIDLCTYCLTTALPYRVALVLVATRLQKRRRDRENLMLHPVVAPLTLLI